MACWPLPHLSHPDYACFYNEVGLAVRLLSALDFSESVGRLEKEAEKTKGILKASGNMSHVTGNTSHVTRNMSHVTGATALS